MHKASRIIYLFARALAWCAVVAAVVGCGGSGGRGTAAGAQDSLYTEARFFEAFDSGHIERALLIADSALARGSVSAVRGEFLRATAYSKDCGEEPHLDSARIIGERLLRHDSVRASTGWQYNVLDILISVTRMQQDYEQCLRFAEEKARICRSQGDEVEALRMDAEVGAILFHLGQTDESLQTLDSVITVLGKGRSVDRMDALIVATKRKMNVLDAAGRPAEVVPLAHSILHKLDDYTRHADSYIEDSYRLPPDSADRENYCQFYRAQAWSFLADAYAEQAHAVSGRRESRAYSDSARRYLARFDDTHFGRTFSGRKMAAPTLLLLGDYASALAIYDKVAQQLGADTISADYATILRGRAEAAEAEGRTGAACDYWKRYADIRSEVSARLQKSEAHHYAVRYKVQEQKARADQARARAKRSRWLATAGILMAIVCATFSLWLLRQQRSINRKNRILAQQISDAVKYKRMYEELSASTPAGGAPGADGSGAGAPPNLATLTDSQLFGYLSEAIRREQLFLNPNFGRQTLTDRFGLSERKIGAAFAQGSQYSSLSEFVRELRLECACHLLGTRPEMSISDVAAASGFSNLTVFGRDFKRKLDVTPTFYRSQMGGQTAD